MVRYYKTTGIYADSNLLRVEVYYNKGAGYEARVTPCSKRNGCDSVCYDHEYFEHYSALICMVIPCSRKSAKNEAEACALVEKKTDWLLNKYITIVKNKGGRHIEIVGELED